MQGAMLPYFGCKGATQLSSSEITTRSQAHGPQQVRMGEISQDIYAFYSSFYWYFSTFQNTTKCISFEVKDLCILTKNPISKIMLHSCIILSFVCYICFSAKALHSNNCLLSCYSLSCSILINRCFHGDDK